MCAVCSAKLAGMLWVLALVVVVPAIAWLVVKVLDYLGIKLF